MIISPLLLQDPCNLAHIAVMMPHRAACNLPTADLAVLSLRIGVIVRSESQGGAGCVKWHAKGLIYRLIRPVDSPYEMNEACCTRYISITTFIGFTLLLQSGVMSSGNHEIFTFSKESWWSEMTHHISHFQNCKTLHFSENCQTHATHFLKTFHCFKISIPSLHGGKLF